VYSDQLNHLATIDLLMLACSERSEARELEYKSEKLASHQVHDNLPLLCAEGVFAAGAKTSGFKR
jgi:hypothetical protein